MATETVDLSAVDASLATADASVSEAPALETQDTGVETAQQSSMSESGDTSTETKATAQPTAKQEGPALPITVAQALKSLTESNPNNKELQVIAKQLRDSFFADSAFKKEFGSLNNVRELKATLRSIAPEAKNLNDIRSVIQSQSELADVIAAADQAIYDGDPSISENIISDLESQGKLEALPKLINHLTEGMKKVSPDAWTSMRRGRL